jgi:hypothetical protein
LGVPLVLVAAVVVLVVGAVAQIGPTSGPYRRTVDRGYAALAEPLVVKSNASGVALQTFLHDGRSLDRVAFFAQLDALVTDTAAVRRLYDTITPPEPVSTAARHCAAAMTGRAAAVASLRSVLEGVVGGPTGLDSSDHAAAAVAMTSAGTVLRAADTSWAVCRRGLRRAPGTPQVPASTWIHAPDLFAPDAAGRFVAAIAGARALAPVHNLAVVDVVTSPAPVASAQALAVSATTMLVVHVVVTNRGNVSEKGVEVGAVATAAGAPASPVPVQHTVDLAAGASTTLVLPGFGVEPGSSYTLQITAESPGVPGSGAVASRSISVQVQLASALTAVTSSAAAGVRGRPVTFTAGLTPSPSGVGFPSGTVAFDDDGATIPGCDARPVRSGEATCSTTYTEDSTHAITATYSGDTRFSGSTSPAITLRVSG